MLCFDTEGSSPPYTRLITCHCERQSREAIFYIFTAWHGRALLISNFCSHLTSKKGRAVCRRPAPSFCTDRKGWKRAAKGKPFRWIFPVATSALSSFAHRSVAARREARHSLLLASSPTGRARKRPLWKPFPPTKGLRPLESSHPLLHHCRAEEAIAASHSAQNFRRAPASLVQREGDRVSGGGIVYSAVPL